MNTIKKKKKKKSPRGDQYRCAQKKPKAHLDVSDGEHSDPSVQFSLKPVPVDLLEDVHSVSLAEGQLSG